MGHPAEHFKQEPLTGDLLASEAAIAIKMGQDTRGKFAKFIQSEQAQRAITVVKEQSVKAGGALAFAGRQGLRIAKRYPARSLVLGVGLGVAVFLLARSLRKSVDVAFDEAATP